MSDILRFALTLVVGFFVIRILAVRDANSVPIVLCFGEVLWDCLPGGELPGGAPLNVAYHLTKLGCTARLLSGVGDDARGKALLQRLGDWGLGCDGVGVAADRPTGVVHVTVEKGVPSYKIATSVAWDRIAVPDALAATCQAADAIVYGSLAMRDRFNRSSLARVLREARSALTVFDVNLRPPYDDHELVWTLAREAELVKLNDEEIGALLGHDCPGDDLERCAREFAERASCDRVCVTAGADGAGLLDSDRWNWVAGETVTVGDTVGAGDAFLAALVAGLLAQPKNPEEILARASRLAAFVASQVGATPDYDVRALT